MKTRPEEDSRDYFIMTRYTNTRGTVIKHLYGPYATRHIAQQEVDKMKADIPAADLKRSEFAIHRPKYIR